MKLQGFPGGSANAGDIRDAGSTCGWVRVPGGEGIPPIPLFLPGESHGQRSLPGYSPWDRRVRQG